MLALDAKTGKVAWRREAHRGPPAGGRHRKNTYASETPATDGERVYASFGGNVGVFCYSMDGQAAVVAHVAATEDLSRLRHRLVAGRPQGARLSAPRQRRPVVPRRARRENRQGALEREAHRSRRAPGLGLGDTAHLGARPAHRDRHHRPRLRHQLRHRRARAVAAQGDDPGDAQPGGRRRAALRRIGLAGRGESAAAGGASRRDGRHHAGRERDELGVRGVAAAALLGLHARRRWCTADASTP